MTGADLVLFLRKLDALRKELAGIRRALNELQEGFLEAVVQDKQGALPYPDDELEVPAGPTAVE